MLACVYTGAGACEGQRTTLGVTFRYFRHLLLRQDLSLACRSLIGLHWSLSPRDLLVSSSWALELQVSTMPDMFLCGHWESNSGPSVCKHFSDIDIPALPTLIFSFFNFLELEYQAVGSVIACQTRGIGLTSIWMKCWNPLLLYFWLTYV